jgi:hypothetical protein
MNTSTEDVFARALRLCSDATAGKLTELPAGCALDILSLRRVSFKTPDGEDIQRWILRVRLPSGDEAEVWENS